MEKDIEILDIMTKIKQNELGYQWNNKDENIHKSDALKLRDKRTLTLLECQKRMVKTVGSFVFNNMISTKEKKNEKNILH